MKLSNRLMAIVEFVEKDARVIDIGTDHGYIPVYLMENKIAKSVIASDISPGSLEKIVDYVRENKLEESIDTRLGDGLDVMKASEADTAIIAGMGGFLIRDILEKNKQITDSLNYFILQPMVASLELRQYLLNSGFKIIDEELAKEGEKYYEVILAAKDLDSGARQLDYDISPILIKKKHPLLKGFILTKIGQLETIKIDLKGKNTKKAKERYNEIKKNIKSYKEVLKTIES